MRSTTWLSILLATVCAGAACDSGEEVARPRAEPPAPLPEETRAAPAPPRAVERVARTAPEPPGAPPANNLLVNPGFEAGREGWSWRESSPYWSNFAIAESPVRSGKRAAHLPVRQAPSDPVRKARVWGVVQEPSPAAFPTRIGGWYRVERWEKQPAETDVYLQLVVIVWGDPRTASLVDPLRPNPQLRNYQLRYYLAGQPEPAFRVKNAKIEIVSGEDPPLGEWVHFELPVADDFRRLWGVLPENFESIRLFFEARWDNLAPDGTVAADVYYDDLYVIIPPTAP